MAEFDYSKFRENLRRLIYSRGLSVKAFGEKTNITSATLSRYLAGNRNPDLQYIIKISQFFNVSIDWLLGINGEQFDVMPAELQDIVNLYSLSSPDDRRVVQAVLSKYRSIDKK